MPRIPEILSTERLPASALQSETSVGVAGVESRVLAEGAARVGKSVGDFLDERRKQREAADALDALKTLSELDAGLADDINDLLRNPDYRTHVDRAEAAFARREQEAFQATARLGDTTRVLVAQEIEKRKRDFAVKARAQQQSFYRDEYRAKLFDEINTEKRTAMQTADPAEFARSLTRLAGLYDIGAAGGLITQQERETKLEKDLNHVSIIRAEAAIDANPELFLADAAAGSWRFIDPSVLARMTDRASREARQQRNDLRVEAEREEKRVSDAMKAAQQRVVSEGTGAYLDLIKKNAPPQAFAAALKVFESEANIFGVDKSSDDYRRVREALEKPFFQGGLDSPQVVNQVKLLVRLGRITTDTALLEYRGHGVSDATIISLIDLLRTQQREGDVSTLPQFKEGRDRILIAIGRGAFGLPGMGQILAPQQAAQLEQALDEYTSRARALFARNAQDATGQLRALATEIIRQHTGPTLTPPPTPRPTGPPKPVGSSSGVNRLPAGLQPQKRQ